jgi:cytoskeletal protein CcmA (bactofilin family)
MANPSESLESVVIGDGVVVKGAFTVPAKAVINGVIEGDLTAEDVLIGPTGRITGRVSAKIIDVRGQLHNTIVSERSLIVRSTGKIVGKIHYSEIEIEKGGEIEGTLSQGAEPVSNAPITSPAVASASAPLAATPAAASLAVKPPISGN